MLEIRKKEMTIMTVRCSLIALSITLDYYKGWGVGKKLLHFQGKKQKLNHVTSM